MIVLLILAFVAVALFEIPKMAREKLRRELFIFSGLLLFAFVLCLLQVLGVIIPSPIKAIMYFFKNVLHLAYQ